MKEIVLALLCACSQDVSILKLQDDVADTATVIVDTEDTDSPIDTEEPVE